MSHSSFFTVTNMSIHKKYVSYYSHCSFFIDTIFKIWVYKGMIIHLVLFIVTNMSIHKKYVSYYSHCSFFIATNFEIWVYKGMIIYLFIYLFIFESFPRSIFLKFGVCPRIVHFTLLKCLNLVPKRPYLGILG